MVVAELLRCPVGERGMRSHAFVITAPSSQHGASLGEKRERRLIHALVPEPAVGALDERALLRLARLDVMLVEARPLSPSQDRHTSEFGAVVGNARHRLASDRYDGVEFSRHPSARERRIGDERQGQSTRSTPSRPKQVMRAGLAVERSAEFEDIVVRSNREQDGSEQHGGTNPHRRHWADQGFGRPGSTQILH